MDLISQLLDKNKTHNRLPLIEWIRRANIHIDGKPYSTYKHEYLKDILEDEHPDQTFEKAAQVGMSSLMLYKALWVSDCLGLNTAYYFYNDLSVIDFVNGRVVPTIKKSDYLTRQLKEVDNVRIKQVGNGTLYFRGLGIRGQVKSIPADFIILDELDESPQENLEYATDRLLHSELQWQAYLSQPSLPNEGIDRQFLKTDQRYWNLICPDCGHHNCLELDFPANFIPISDKQRKKGPKGKTHYRGCVRCKKPLDMSQGVWVPLYPGNQDRRGYHLSQLYAQRKPSKYPNWASFIMSKYEDSLGDTAKSENFSVSYLGFPYSGAGARITDEILSNCQGTHGFCDSGSGCFLGVDQGDKLHIVVGQLIDDKLHVIYCEETEHWQRIPQLIDRYNVSLAVLDSMPNKLPAKEIAGEYGNRVYIQYFQRDFRVNTEPHLGKYLVNTVNVNRTESLDSTVDALETQKIILPNPYKVKSQYLPIYEKLLKQLKELKSVIKTDNRGNSKKEYIGGRNVANHFGMALNSMRIAALELGGRAPTTTVMPQFIKW